MSVGGVGGPSPISPESVTVDTTTGLSATDAKIKEFVGKIFEGTIQDTYKDANGNFNTDNLKFAGFVAQTLKTYLSNHPARAKIIEAQQQIVNDMLEALIPPSSPAAASSSEEISSLQAKILELSDSDTVLGLDIPNKPPGVTVFEQDFAGAITVIDSQIDKTGIDPDSTGADPNKIKKKREIIERGFKKIANGDVTRRHPTIRGASKSKRKAFYQDQKTKVLNYITAGGLATVNPQKSAAETLLAFRGLVLKYHKASAKDPSNSENQKMLRLLCDAFNDVTIKAKELGLGSA